MNFKDIFKSSFLENITSISIIDMLVALLLSFCVGLFIFFCYKKTNSKIMYSSGFGVSLVALCMITTLVILAVTSNVVLSLGMVGALSIVRFRAAIKEPLDICYLFWSIGAGIVLAAGMIPLAVIGSIFIGIMLLVFANRKPHASPYIVIISCETQQSEKEAFALLKKSTNRVCTKSKTVKAGQIEVNYEIRLKNEDTDFVNALYALSGVKNCVLVSYNGDYAG